MEEERLPFEIKECLQLMITTVSILFLGSHSLCLNHKIGLYLTEVLTESYFNDSTIPSFIEKFRISSFHNAT